jgi:ubiquitin-protein ligase
MIQFTCPGCGRAFAVPEQFAGRKANCKNCGGPIIVPSGPGVTAPLPAAIAAPAVPAAPPRTPMRTRRLQADATQMSEVFANSELIKVKPLAGNPPEAYQVEYSIVSLERGRGGKPVARDKHLVEIRLTSDYPRLSPQCKMLTPVFHPNIDPSTICVGDHWTAGERLVDLTVRIGEMLAYQAYNIQSPLDAEAAMWADLNQSKLPTDPRPLRPGDA